MTVLPADRDLTIAGQTGDRVSTEAPEGVNSIEVTSEPTDEARLVAAAQTDRAAFGKLYDRYFDAIFHYIARRVGDTETAEDLSAAVWERALIAIERYEVRGLPFSSWLYRIAGNVVANHHRQRRRWRMVPLLPRHATSDLSDTVLESASVRTAFRALSVADQEVLSLRYFADRSPTEMAEILGCSVTAVHKRLGRARDRLRQQLENGDGPT